MRRVGKQRPLKRRAGQRPPEELERLLNEPAEQAERMGDAMQQMVRDMCAEREARQ